MTVAIIGAGVMGETLLSGLLRGGHDAADLMVGEKRAERAVELREKYGVRVVSDLAEVAGADTVALVVKPQDMGDVLTEIAPHAAPRPAAGQPGRRHHHRVHREAHPRRHRGGARHAEHPGPGRRGHGRDLARHPLRRGAPRARRGACSRSTGRVVRVPEKQQDAVTAISGSGPAYLFFVVEAMIEAGVHLGLPRTHRRPSWSCRPWSARPSCCARPATHPTVLREQVTSPGGTTAAAIRAARGPQGAGSVHHGHGGRARPVGRPRCHR